MSWAKKNLARLMTRRKLLLNYLPKRILNYFFSFLAASFTQVCHFLPFALALILFASAMILFPRLASLLFFFIVLIYLNNDLINRINKKRANNPATINIYGRFLLNMFGFSYFIRSTTTFFSI
jgi:hypothetical protein